MVSRGLLVLVGCFSLSAAVHAVDPMGRKVSVVCSQTGPSSEGFMLVSVPSRKDRAAGKADTREGIRYAATYDKQIERLKVEIHSIDEDGDDAAFLASMDTHFVPGEHARLIFNLPTAQGASEKVEMVCNGVVH